jgi:hypothetical protein
MNLNPNFKTFFENDQLVLGHEFEQAYIFDKTSQETWQIFEFDNDPTCGVIGENNDWCLVGGQVLVLWTKNLLEIIDHVEQIYELRLLAKNKAHILTDPWSGKSAIWELEIENNKTDLQYKLKKLKDFDDYFNKPYTENVFW